MLVEHAKTKAASNKRVFEVMDDSSDEAANIYKKILNLVKQPIKGFGKLGVNHLIAAGSILGLYPSWFYGQCILDPSCKAFAYVVNNFRVKTAKPAEHNMRRAAASHSSRIRAKTIG